MKTSTVLLLVVAAAAVTLATAAGRFTGRSLLADIKAFRPLGDKVLVKIDLTSTSKGMGKAEETVVVAAGPGVGAVPMDVKVGDRVVVERTVGVDVKFDDQSVKDKYKVVRQSEPLGVLALPPTLQRL